MDPLLNSAKAAFFKFVLDVVFNSLNIVISCLFDLFYKSSAFSVKA